MSGIIKKKKKKKMRWNQSDCEQQEYNFEKG